MLELMFACCSLAFSQQSSISDRVAFSAPKGWAKQETEILGDPVVAFSSGGVRMSLELFGGKDSRHETPAAFLESPEARPDSGEPALSLGRVTVSGRKGQAYARRYTMSGRGRAPDEIRAKPMVMDQQFVIMELGKRFLVASWVRGSLPDLAGKPAVEKLQPEFAKFLKNLKLRRNP